MGKHLFSCLAPFNGFYYPRFPVSTQQVQKNFPKILISTEAGGEGVKLQFCHVGINYDIPWNPMRLEQRIGRMDRIGQAHAVRAVNCVFDGSVEHRARIAREREKADYAFAACRKTVERIGLPQVRNYRLNVLRQEERSLHEQLDQKAHAYPEMVPLLVIRVEENRE